MLSGSLDYLGVEYIASNTTANCDCVNINVGNVAGANGPTGSAGMLIELFLCC